MAITIPALRDSEIVELRADFPALSRVVNGHPLVYLDSGATSQKPRQVLDAERRFLETQDAAVHRGAHTMAAEATELFEDARATLARFVNAEPDKIVWTANATAAANLLAYSLGNTAPSSPLHLSPGDEIVVTELEHHANLIPWQQLAARTGARLRYIPVDDEGGLRLDLLEEVITPRARVVAFSHVSNVLGVVSPVDAIVARAHAVGALIVLDACQSAPHIPIDVRALGVDAMFFSGHKMLGPTGVGVLWGRAELLAALPPFLTGGSMITTVTMEKSEFLPPPQRFEAGTQPVSQAIALAAAVDYLSSVGVARIAEHEHHLGERLTEGLGAIAGVRVLGAEGPGHRVGLASFVVDGIHTHDLGQYLDDQGIAIRVGHHCAAPLHRRLGVTASTRASTYLYSTADEVDRLLEGVTGAITFSEAPSERRMSDELEELYREVILSHSRRPHGRGLTGGTDATSHQVNPTCGDEITFELHFDDDGSVSHGSWDGHGCAISQASASLLTQLLPGLTPTALSERIDGFRTAMRSRGTIEPDEALFGDASALAGVSRYSARVKCAMLAWVAAEDALDRSARLS